MPKQDHVRPKQKHELRVDIRPFFRFIETPKPLCNGDRKPVQSAILTSPENREMLREKQAAIAVRNLAAAHRHRGGIRSPDRDSGEGSSASQSPAKTSTPSVRSQKRKNKIWDL